ncbi:MAG: cupin domain-containing protein [Usitatibacter sp.]
MKIRIRPFAAALALVAIATLAPSVDAQAPGIKRTLLQRTDIGDNREVILGLAEIAPGGSTGRHTHFGVETGYVIEGTSSLEIDGEAARILKAGDSYTIAAGKVHNAKAVGEAPAKVLATYVVDKGKPLATPAP